MRSRPVIRPLPCLLLAVAAALLLAAAPSDAAESQGNDPGNSNGKVFQHLSPQRKF